MFVETIAQLREKKCVPCEGGVPPVSRADAERLLMELSGWRLADDGRRIVREWHMKNFQAAIDFINRVAHVAEEEGHHPDLHLVGYRNVAVELTTHAIGGLSENDFVVAAKIDQLPAELKAS